MGKETLDKRDEFLLQNGIRVNEVREVGAGDVLGMVLPKAEEVRLSYVDSVHLNSDFIKFDYFPYAQLKGPFFGFYVSEKLELEGFKYLSLSQVHSAGRIWKPGVILKELPLEQQEIQKEFLEEFPEDSGRVYVMNEGNYKDLGNLIPLVELPSLSFLLQSRDLEELVRMVKDSKEDIEAIRKASHNLKEKYKIF